MNNACVFFKYGECYIYMADMSGNIVLILKSEFQVIYLFLFICSTAWETMLKINAIFLCSPWLGVKAKWPDFMF